MSGEYNKVGDGKKQGDPMNGMPEDNLSVSSDDENEQGKSSFPSCLSKCLRRLCFFRSVPLSRKSSTGSMNLLNPKIDGEDDVIGSRPRSSSA